MPLISLEIQLNLRLSAAAVAAQTEGGKTNAALFNVVRGTVAFVAGQAAKNGDMKFQTPSATLGIRGTTGVLEVPDGGGVRAPPVSGGGGGRAVVRVGSAGRAEPELVADPARACQAGA